MTRPHAEILVTVIQMLYAGRMPLGTVTLFDWRAKLVTEHNTFHNVVLFVPRDDLVAP